MKACFILSSEEFSCERVQNQACLDYNECSRNHLCVKFYAPDNLDEILTTLYIGSFTSAYIKGYAIN